MKRISSLILVAFALISSHLIQTRIGCLAKSQGLTVRFDTKTLHAVQCNCDCDRYRARGLYNPTHNECLNCGHQHDVQPLIIVTKIAQIAAERNVAIEDPKHALQLLIDQYRNRQ
jgi:hypothetical protein